MTSWYIDTSVLGAFYCPETLSDKAQSFLEKADSPIISSLTQVEMYSLVAKKTRVGDLSKVTAKKVLEEFNKHITKGIYNQLVPQVGHYLRAMNMIGELSVALSTRDALHLSMVEGEDLTIATADYLMFKAAKKFKIEAKLIG